MIDLRLIRRWALLLAAGATATLSGCGATDASFGPMMARPGMAPLVGSGPTVTHIPMPGMGPGIMDGEPGEMFSRTACSAPTSLPGSIVTVVLNDMGTTMRGGGAGLLGTHLMLRATPIAVPAGQISLVVLNRGWRTHELVVLPLRAGVAAGQRSSGPDGKVDETESLVEVSNSCAQGLGDGITSGAVGWTTVDLNPGRYELVCNLQNHYANGMHQMLLVT